MTNTAPAETPQPPRLDDQLCFALHAASRAFDSMYRVLLQETGLTYPQYLVLLVLWEHGEISVKNLGERLRLDSGTLSPLLKRLEVGGFVERHGSSRDERSVVVRVTEAGDALRGRACDVSMGVAGSTGLDLAKVVELRTSLNELTATLDRAVKKS